MCATRVAMGLTDEEALETAGTLIVPNICFLSDFAFLFLLICRG